MPALQTTPRNGGNVRPMIDHVGVRVQDFPKLLAFYREALAPIGYSVLMEFPDAAGLGAKGKPDLWIMKTDKTPHPTHVAIGAAERAHIDAFHAAGLSAGGSDNGAAGLRADFHPHYYAAFILDPEGNNIEVVCHDAPKAKASKKSAAKVKAKSKAKPAKKVAKKVTKAVVKKAVNKKAAAKKPVAKAKKKKR
jgi:catechol 2,3-dioxygenase-like lactoylglutathione lyase family enzyme